MRSRRAIGPAVALLVFLVDRGLKSLLGAHLVAGQPVDLFGPVRLNRTENAGAAFGILPGATWLFLVVTVLVVVVVARFMWTTRSRAGLAALGLVLGGTLANAWDRLLFGRVLDYVDIRVWPVFNAADAAITIGIATLLVGSLLPQARAEPGS
ncbi:MAG: signal peptidase II [Candidatus Dormibacteria bacterium]